jgi:phosphatidylglycerol---prolipoprotein diacylglyceryl transferase
LHPILFEFGPFSLHTYGLAMAAAFGVGIWITTRRAEPRGFSPKFVLDLSVLILIFSLLGARFLYVVTHWGEFAAHPLDVISPFQSNGQIGIAGLVLLGGVIAAFATVFYYSRRRGFAFFAVTDLFIPATALGIAIGRLGCFFNGCCFGLPTSLPWGLVFPSDSLAGSVFPGTCVHPTQIYESLWMLLVFAGLLLWDRRARGLGQLTGLFLLFYGIGRFYIESLRWYEHQMILFQIGAARLTISQVLSAAMILCGAALIARSLKQPAVRTKPAPKS